MTLKKPSKKPTDAGLKKHLAELEDSYKRLAAEFANFQRRTEEEKIQIARRSKTQLLEHLFPVMDNLERSSAHAPTINVDEVSALTEEDFKKMASYFAGLRLIEKQLETVLQNAGLKRIATAGVAFDHNLHEAISHELNKDVPADHIIAEVESGWQIGDHVIRPAKVRVSKG